MITRTQNSFILALLASVALPTLAHAQAQPQTPPDSPESSTSTLEEVVVTARRVSESMQRVPVAITALSQETLQRNSIIQVEEVQRVTPGFQVNATTRGSSTPGFAIRGQRAYNVNLLTDPAVSVYFADVGQARTTGTNQTLFDLASVQILKGPQGTLFGRNTTGGAILINPRLPGDAFDGYISASAGDYNFRDIEGAVTLPLGDTLSVRLSGKVSQRDGYFTNVVNGQKAQDLDAQSYRAIVSWKPTDNFSSDLIATYFTSDEVGTAVKLKYFDPRGIPAAFPAPARAALAATYAAELANAQSLGRYEYRNSIPFRTESEVWGIQNTTTLDFKVDGWDTLSLKNIFGYRKIDSTYNADTDGGLMSIIDYRGVMNEDQISNELQLIGKRGNLDFIAGLFYFKEEGIDGLDQFRQFDVLTPAATAPTPLVYQDFDGTNTSYSAFAHANYDLEQILTGLSLSGGLRFTKDIREADFHSRNEVRFPTGTNSRAFRCTLTGVINSSLDRDLCSQDAKAEFEKVTYDVSVNYQMTSDILLYLAKRRGYRAGGFNTTPVNATQTAPFEPEIVDDYEFGVKSQFDLGGMPVRINGAIFTSDYSNVQRLTSTVIGTTLSSQIVNAAAATIQGIELELNARPASWLEVTAGYSGIDAKYDEWFDTYNVGGVPTKVDISDSGFTYIPENQFNASATFHFPVPAGLGDASLLVGYYYQSEIDTLENNTKNCGPDGLYAGCLNEPTKIDGYGIWNLRASWSNVLGRGFDVSAFVNNVTDEYYENVGFALVGAIGTYATAPGAPRMFGLQVRMPFGAGAE